MTPDALAEEALRLDAAAYEAARGGNATDVLQCGISALTHAVLSLRPGPALPADATVTAVPEVTASPVGAELLLDRDGDLWADIAGEMSYLRRRAHAWLVQAMTRQEVAETHGPLVPLPQPGAPS